MTPPSWLFFMLLVAALLCRSTCTAFLQLKPRATTWKKFYYGAPASITRYTSGLKVAQEEEEEVLDKDDAITTTQSPIFDFSDSNNNETDRFERIDDVIMGGISSSTLRQMNGEPFARWSGVCREDGGGFCGIRTLPFQRELNVQSGVYDDAQGIYVTCRFSSDDEPDRRIWKITTRTEESRGEQLYQAMFTIPTSSSETTSSSDDDKQESVWHSIQIPFKEFRLVRGARLVPNAEPLNIKASKGLYQIGMTMSKFSIAENMTSIDNFRPGYFELQIKQIGLYYNSNKSSWNKANNDSNNIIQKQKEQVPVVVESLSKEEAMAQRPLLLKLLLPLSVIAFTEKSQTRKSAMRLLTKERGLTRLQAIRFGLQWRAKQVGWLKSIAKTLSILLADSARQSIRSIIRYGIFVPLRLIVRIGKLLFTKRKKRSEPSVSL